VVEATLGITQTLPSQPTAEQQLATT